MRETNLKAKGKERQIILQGQLCLYYTEHVDIGNITVTGTLLLCDDISSTSLLHGTFGLKIL